MDSIIHEIRSEQLKLNQTFADLIHDYEDLYENEPELMHAKGLMKYIWNRGYKLSPITEEDYVSEKDNT
jgi:hypothetical protein